MYYKLLDLVREKMGLSVNYVDPMLRPIEPGELSFTTDKISSISDKLDKLAVAERLHHLRPSVAVQEFTKQIENPIASRAIAIWAEIYIPALKKTILLDSRIDNPGGLPPSIRDIPDDSPKNPWPNDKQNTNYSVNFKGHSGSSCPGMFSKFLHGNVGASEWLEIPVEVLAFHCEGKNRDCTYSISMFSEVLGRVTTRVGDPSANLNMWGRMLITLRPNNPENFRGHKVLQLVSEDYIKQQGTITGFPPHGAGEYIESYGNERYVGLNPGQRHIEAIVKKGRIIFSTDEDDFLQARTRITHFNLLDKYGEIIPTDNPPYDPSIVKKIKAVKLFWRDIRKDHSDVTHYLIYRIDPDKPKDFEFLDRTDASWFIDNDYNGRQSLGYAVVPAFHDSVGMEVQGVSLDHSLIMAIDPNKSMFNNRNHGIGHVRTV